MAGTERRYRLEPTGGDRLRSFRAGWVDAGGRKLFVRLHLPRGGRALGGIVLCAPLLVEHYHGHRALVQLGNLIADAGFVALRFDYWGVGDSEGSTEQIGDVSAWGADVSALADLLRSWGVEWISGVGLRGSANIIAAHATPALDACVLWDPVRDGRQHLREMTLVHRTVSPEDDSPGTGSVCGYAFSSSFVRSLRALPPIGSPAIPTLILTRDGLAPGADALGEGVSVGVAAGQEALLERNLDRSAVPIPTLQSIVSWISERQGGGFSCEVLPAIESRRRRGNECEAVEWLPVPGSTPLFAVSCWSSEDESSAGGDVPTVVALNSGAQSHIGPHRFHVDLARTLAKDGVRTWRVDLPGRGESLVVEDPLMTEAPSLAVEACALDALVEGARSRAIVVVGLCSGSLDALDATRRDEVVAAACINPFLGGQREASSVREAHWQSGTRCEVGARPWLRRAMRSRWGLAATWRIPGRAWVVLDWVRVQGDLSRAFALRAGQGKRLLLLIARSELAHRRMWGVTHRARGRWEVVEFDGDHELAASGGRQVAIEVCRDFVMRVTKQFRV